MQPIHGSWIYHNEKLGAWQVKVWEEGRAKILGEFRTRGEAIQFAYGVR